MVWLDGGISGVQTVAIRNESGFTPTYLTYGGSDNTFTGSETVMNNEILRLLLDWEPVGNNSKFVSLLSSMDGNGSYFGALGLQYGNATGSGLLFSNNPSFIGNKTQAFNVQIEGEVILRRPNV